MALTFKSLRRAQAATRIEFTPGLARRHTFVRLLSGRWARVLGQPDPRVCKHVRGRVFHVRPGVHVLP